MSDAGRTIGLLGDTPERMYADKLERFNRFAEPEIRNLIERTELQPGSRVLDAGCGAGLTSGWFKQQVGPNGLVIGCDLSTPHLRAARNLNAAIEDSLAFLQCDISRPPFRDESFDLIWCANTINHLGDPVSGVRQLAATLRPGGQIALVQSGFLPDMFFAWDERLEQAVMTAVRQYYRAKYALDERDVTAMRGLLGLAQRGGLVEVTSQTVVVERTAPLSDIDREYLVQTVFNGYWGEKLRPYLTVDDWSTVQRLCDPASPDFCLDRPDFHHLQTLTMVTGRPSPRPGGAAQ